MRSRARTAVAATLLLATLAGPSSAWAKPSPKWLEADQHFRHGVQLFKEADYTAALVEFERAYATDPKYQVLYNIAESHYQLQDYANALRTFRRYLEEGGAKIPFKRRKDVEAEIVTLSKRVATLTVTTNEPGATVAIDDVYVGTTPLEPLMVSAGRRKVTAKLSGRPSVTEKVDLAGGDEKTLALEIEPLPPPAPVAPPPGPPATPPSPPSLVPPIVAWSATGALLTGGIVTGALALGASSDLEEELARYPGDPDALASAKSSAFGLALASDVLFVSSAVAAAVSIYLTIDYASGPDATSSEAKSPSMRWMVVPGGVVVDGSF
jgi:tetratricopeptide (TPR) repeat protein